MNYYIEHDRRNYCVRTMNQDEVRLQYGSNALNVLAQDGSLSLANGVDIYLDCCYPSPATIVDSEVKDALQSMRFRVNRF